MIFLNLYLAKSKKSYYICLALVNNFENVIKKGGEIRLCETLATLQNTYGEGAKFYSLKEGDNEHYIFQ